MVDHRALLLDNGLRVVALPRRSGLAMVWVRYHVGAADDPPTRRGLAHLVEHLLFTGSKHTYGADAADHLYSARALGANGATAMHTTDYYAMVPRENLARVLWLASDRMGFMRGEVSAREIELARGVVAAELRMIRGDEQARLFGAVHNAVYPLPHPYFDPEDAGALVGVDVAAVEEFLRRFVVPANAQLVVAAGLPAAEIEGLVRRYFSDLPGGAAPVRREVPASPIAREVRLRAIGSQVMVKLAWPSPALGSAGDAAADLTAVVLGHNFRGRLWAEDGPIARLDAQQVSRAGGSLFCVQATGREGTGAEEVLAAIDEAVSRLREVSAAEMQLARRVLRVDWLTEQGSLAGLVAEVHAHMAGAGQGPERYEGVEVGGFVGGTLMSGRRVALLAEPGGGR